MEGQQASNKKQKKSYDTSIQSRNNAMKKLEKFLEDFGKSSYIQLGKG